MTPATATGEALRLARTYDVSRELVYRAWTEPARFAQWFGMPGIDVPEVEMDLRPGGRYRITMRKLPGGAPFYLEGEYREVKPPARIVFTWAWNGEGMKPDHSTVTVEFREVAGGTEVVVLHEGLEAGRARDGHDRGWSASAARLADALTAQRDGGMSPAERDFAVAALEHSRDEFLRETEGLLAAQWLYRESPERWSVAQNAEHLAMVEEQMVHGHLLANVLSSPADRSPSAGNERGILEFMRAREPRFPAPDAFAVRYDPDGPAAAARFAKAREKTLEFVRNTRLNLRVHGAPNPGGTYWDLYQWMVAMGGHTDRHVLQIREIKAWPGWPR